MRFQPIFAEDDEDGLSPFKEDEVKSGEISTVKAGSDKFRLAKHTTKNP